MLELKNKILKIKFNDEICEVKHPTVKQHMEFSVAHDKVKDDTVKSVECMMNFLVTQGLSENIASMLEPEHLNEILTTIGGGKKK
jgi:arginine repressor